MDYKLLRALSIVLQTGLVILLLLLLSIVFLACKPVDKNNTAKSSMQTEAQKDVIQQRLLKDIQQHQRNLKTLCFESQVKQNNHLLKAQLAKVTFNNTENSLATQRF
jgi:hypothetical protein